MKRKRFKAVYHKWIEGRPVRRFADIFARDMEQAQAKWCAMRSDDEELLSLYIVLSSAEYWKSIGQ